MFVLVSGIAHGLAARWLLANFASARRRKGLVIGITVLLTVLPGLGRMIVRSQPSPFWMSVFAALMIEVTSVTIAVMPVTIASIFARSLFSLLDARRAKAALATEAREPAVDAAAEDASESEISSQRAALQRPPVKSLPPDLAPDRTTRREAIERIAGVSVFAGTGLALGWGAVRGRHAFQLEEVVVKVAGWPKALDGYTIAQISDIHVGGFVGDRELGEGLEVVKRAKPDLVVATGDLVDFRSELVSALAVRLADLDVRDGVAAILGNHDHYAGPADVVDGLQRSGVRVLSNDSLRVRKGDGGGFLLVGLDDLAGRARPQKGFTGPDLARAIAGHPPEVPRILLAHQPNFFKESAGRVALQLSGHTHGGQINPGFRPADLLMTFVSGRYERNGSTLWVNRGFGVAGPPSRVGAPPEVTKIVIVSA